MAQPRPSLMLVLDIDERLDSKEMRQEIDRCYSYIGQTIVRTHPKTTCPASTLVKANAEAAERKGARAAEVAGKAAGAASNDTSENLPEPINIIRFLVRLGTRKYMDSTQVGADEIWHDVMERWFSNMFHKVSNQLQIFNRRQREENTQELNFTWLTVELDGGDTCVWMHLDSESGIDSTQSKQLSILREKMNASVFESKPVCVVMPDPAEYERQKVAGLAAKAEREAAEALAQAEEEKKAAAEKAAQAEAEEGFLEIEPTEAEKQQLEYEQMRAEIEEKFSLKEPDFAIDYHIWRVECADDSVHVFDSDNNSFCQGEKPVREKDFT